MYNKSASCWSYTSTAMLALKHPSFLNHPLVPDAAGLGGQLLGASDRLEADRWVISVLEPVEPPLASGLELRREAVAVRALRDAAVLLAPAICWRSPLSSTGVEDAYTSTGDSKIEVVVSKVATRVGSLHNHLLAGDGTGCEGQPEGQMLVRVIRPGITHALTRNKHSTSRSQTFRPA